MKGRVSEWERYDREMEARMVWRVVWFNGVIIIISSRAQKRTPVNPKIGNRVIKNPEDGISLVASQRTRRWIQVAGQLGPMCATNGACDTTMANIGGDAGKVESMRALSSEYSRAWASAGAVTQGVKTYRAQVLLHNKRH